MVKTVYQNQIKNNLWLMKSKIVYNFAMLSTFNLHTLIFTKKVMDNHKFPKEHLTLFGMGEDIFIPLPLSADFFFFNFQTFWS